MAGITQAQLDDLLVKYHQSGRPYKLIAACLEEVHGLRRSVAWLKKQFARLKLRRIGEYSPLPVVRNCVQRELRGSNSLAGYRRMHAIMRQKYALNVKRDTVMEIMHQLDPAGVQLRRSHRLERQVYLSKGPNFAWHIDSYDKLSPFGFCINGCIDGFSRRIMWLKVSTTNHDPAVILTYYLECVQKMNGCPTVVRLDCGTENGKVAAVQIAFRMSHGDSLSGQNSVRYGHSHSNVRIEGWWSQLKRHKTGWWIHTLKELEQDGIYDNTNHIHRKCLALVFGTVITRELHEFVLDWNCHHIRHNRLADCPSGRPDDLYHMPNYYGAEDCKKPFISSVWLQAMLQEVKKPSPAFGQEFFGRCRDFVHHHLNIDLHRDISSDNCLQVYKLLINNMS